MQDERAFMERAIELARVSEREGNPPVGAVVVLDGGIVAEGRSMPFEPVYDPGRHAEIVALEGVSTPLWSRAEEMTCYTTLEPCVMCAGTLLLHRIGRVVFGARDERGGAGETLEHLPAYYDEAPVYEWEGPVMPGACRPLAERVEEMFEVGKLGGSAAEQLSGSAVEQLGERQKNGETAGQLGERQKNGEAAEQLGERRENGGQQNGGAEALEAWRAGESEMSSTEAREALEAWVERVGSEELVEVLPYAAELFERGGYLKDYRAFEEYARRAGRPEALEWVDETLREELPDVWIRRALEHGEREAAVECWFEHEGHRRARLVADELLEACGKERTQLLISCRLAQVTHLVERGSRRRYRKACDILRRLRDELEEAGAARYWEAVVEDLRSQYDNRPAWLEELGKV